jgi:uncharacterized membrane protein HdeD (DUF308 family)
VSTRRLLATLALIVGVVLIVIGVVYWVEPAKSLPSFFPGHHRGRHHFVKRGVLAFVLGLACLVFAWIQTGAGRRLIGRR